MGAWGPGSFENDSACDWLSDFLAGEDDQPLYAALDAALEGEDEDLELGNTWAGEQALAAAEVVAALIGRPAANAPPELLGWARQAEGEQDPELAGLAARAVRRVRDGSELRELWQEGDDTAWLAVVDDLLRRLAA